MLQKEWFQCPGCGHANLVEWLDALTTTVVNCVSCRRTVGTTEALDENGVQIGVQPSDMCTCTPPKAETHDEGAQFVAQRHSGFLDPSLVGQPHITGDYLLALKQKHLSAVNEQVREFINSRYGQPQQATLTAMLVSGVAERNTALIAYVGSALAWVKATVRLYYPLRDEIMAAQTPQDVLAVKFDPASAPPDPMVTIEHAMTL